MLLVYKVYLVPECLVAWTFMAYLDPSPLTVPAAKLRLGMSPSRRHSGQDRDRWQYKGLAKLSFNVTRDEMD